MDLRLDRRPALRARGMRAREGGRPEAAPVAQAAPAGQTTQSCSLVIGMVSDAFWCRPEGHGSAAEAPAKQNAPAVQGTHAVCPAAA